MKQQIPALLHKPMFSLVPKIGERLKVDLTMIRQDDDQSNDGQPATAMTKIRFHRDLQQWLQVAPNEAGMYVFFENDPLPGLHKEFQVTAIIPAQTGCYAKLMS